ncbi:Cytochrome bd ubiquinol oxidase, partial [Globisporangium splendens]
MSGIVARVASLYQKRVGKSFAMYGLKYDDVLVDTAAVQEALHWVSKDEYTSRTRRIARAADCSLKHTYLPEEIQSIQKPLDTYLSHHIDAAEELADERAELTRCDRPPLRARPMSAKPSAASQSSSSTFSLFGSTRSFLQAQGKGANFAKEPQSNGQIGESDGDIDEDEDDEDEDYGFLNGDDEDDDEEDQDEFGDAAERQAKPMPTNPSTHFRPASAPPVRSKPAFNHAHENGSQQRHDPKAAAAMSISHLTAAAEKKKARDREFALELQREETEYKKKITLKIDQANKILLNAGSKKSFALAPDREGVHMIKILDPPANDRAVSVDIFHILLFPHSHYHQYHDSDPIDRSSSSSKRTTTAAGSKAPDRSQIQDELKSVLAGTIELTKVLQDQLHELKLKGWNFASRGTAPAAQ